MDEVVKGRATRAQLEAWFSSPRMATFNFHSDPDLLYIWNTRITKALLEDIQHVEVLLRNAVDTSLSEVYGRLWFLSPRIPFTPQASRAVRKAASRTKQRPENITHPDQVIAELNFDFWFFLLSNRYSTTVWPVVLGRLSGRPNREDFQHRLETIYRLRNRCAHHEPIVMKDRRAEEENLIAVRGNIEAIATFIDPSAAAWIATNSRLTIVMAERP